MLTAADRLFGALLVEMVSGHYAEGARFLSHRQVMRQWRVSATTATNALERLKAAGILKVRDRSGHYLPEAFRELALCALHSNNTLADPTPLKRHRLGMKILLQHREGRPMNSVAVILALHGDGYLLDQNYEGVLAPCAASALTSKGIFLEAEEHRVIVNFFLCDGTPESESHTLNRVLQSRPDGVILVKRKPYFREESLGSPLLKRGIPVIVLYGEAKGSDMIAINFNNVGMGTRAADFFLERGHRNLAVLTHREPNSNFEDRIKGFRLGITKRKDVRVSEFRPGDDPDEFRRIAAELRRKHVTALFSVTQEVLADLHPALKAAGIQVPYDLSLLMCSSTPELQGFPMPMDTLILEFTQLGRIALRAISSYCTGQVAQRVHLLNPEIEIHGSVIDKASLTSFP